MEVSPSLDVMMSAFAKEASAARFDDSGPMADEIFNRSVWAETLTKFSKATGLNISLYDERLNLKCAVTTTSPIGKRLSMTGFWDEGGLGRNIDTASAKIALLQNEPVFNVEFDLFSHLAIPVTFAREIRAVLVLGWIPEKFADPVLCDHFSRIISAPQMELWQIIRMQQPISREKLEMHATMLETFAIPLISQLVDQIEERRRTLRASIISETAVKFAAATTETEICSAAFTSIQKLVHAISISIQITQTKDGVESIRPYRQEGSFPTKVDQSLSTLASHLTIPIPAPQGSPIGRIEMTVAQEGVSEQILRDLQTLASQFGVALQKVLLIQVLESERTALKDANTQLRNMHKMKDEFLATVSHELRTPLNAILGWSQILQEEGPSIPEFETAMATISRNAVNQSHLIEDLLDVSRIISGKMMIQRENVEATALLQQSIATVFPMTEARNQKVHLQISATPIYFRGDATRMTQVFWNLLSNASKFTPEGGDISVVLEKAGHYFKFEISDSGKGISREFLPLLFDRFSQADGSYTRRHGGLGLGLAIVRHLVELHGGTVKAESDGEGKGSRFTIFLPQMTTDVELDSAQELARLHSTRKTSDARRLAGVKILLVDDEPDALRLTTFVLEKFGAVTKITDTAEDAFETLREWRPDVLLSDLSMPVQSGFELIRRVRALSRDDGGSTPAIALTALASRDERELARASGFELHIAKPLEAASLVTSIESLLGLQKTDSRANA